MDYFVETITGSMLPFEPIDNEVENYTVTVMVDGTPTTLKYVNDRSLFAVRTCQSYFQPQETIQYSNIGPFIEGMSSGATEKEDFIITPDLRGDVRIYECTIIKIYRDTLCGSTIFSCGLLQCDMCDLQVAKSMGGFI